MLPICIFTQKTQVFEVCFFVISSNLVLATERNKHRYRGFMTPEGTGTLILAFTSKTGQSVAHNRNRIVLIGFFCQREDIFRHFIGLMPDSRVKAYSR